MNKYLSSSPLFLDQTMLLVRVITGLFMIYHGWDVFETETMNGYLEWDTFKNPSGKTIVYLGKSLELVAGILLTAGFLTRLSAILVIGTMLYISFILGNGVVWYGDQHPFMFVLIGLIFLAAGGGKWSLDRRYFGS